MARPEHPPELVPRQPTTVLGWTMRKLRSTTDWTGSHTAAAFGCSASHVSRVEMGLNRPSRALVQFYEDQFEGNGLLLSVFEVAEHAGEQERRRAGGHHPRLLRAVPGDASEFIEDTIPHGTLMAPSQSFTKTWRIRNSGQVAWVGRRLERQGPLAGPGLITSERYVSTPDAEPGDTIEIAANLRAPGYDCSSIAYFELVDKAARVCFPDVYQLGLDVLVLVRRESSRPPDSRETPVH